MEPCERDSERECEDCVYDIEESAVPRRPSLKDWLICDDSELSEVVDEDAAEEDEGMADPPPELEPADLRDWLRVRDDEGPDARCGTSDANG